MLLSVGKSVSKLEDARTKYMKTTSKAHKAHNDYVCALHEAALHQKSYLRKTLPCLLDYQEQVQQNMVDQWWVCWWQDRDNAFNPYSAEFLKIY